MSFLIDLRDSIIPSATKLAPGLPWTQSASVLVGATCMQESGGRNVWQAPHGPASGYPQFEYGGIRAALTSPATRSYAYVACAAVGLVPVDGAGTPQISDHEEGAGGRGVPLDSSLGEVAGPPKKFLNPKIDESNEGLLKFEMSPDDLAQTVHERFLEFPALQIVFARLLYYANPHPLPAVGDVEAAWSYYLSTWRPGKPRPQDWPGNYAQALAVLGSPK